MNISSFNNFNNKDDDPDDDDENFEQNQRTQRNDDFDWFSKLMRQKMDDSLRLLLQRYQHFLSQYELMLSQNNYKAIKVIEKQLAFLVQTTVSFFSYGLPSGVNKCIFYGYRKAASDDESNMKDVQKEKPKPEFLDFQIIQRILYLCKITNQL